MSWNYDNYLASKLDLLNEDNLKLVVENEQIFAKRERLDPDAVYVVIKRTSSTLTYESTTQPVQLTILAEENTLEPTKALFERLANALNWQIETDGTTRIKQEYSLPVVLQNFAEIGAGYRTILYVSATLLVLESVLDFETIYIDDIAVKPMGCNLTYQMQGNTQQLSGDLLASTVKSVSTLSITITIPYQDLYTKSVAYIETHTFTEGESYTVDTALDGGEFLTVNVDGITIDGTTLTASKDIEDVDIYKYYSLIQAINEITVGDYTGNKDFKIQITQIGLSKNFKLTSSSISTAPSSIPSLQIGLIV